MEGTPGHSEAKIRQMIVMQGELRRLSGNVVPNGYRWSQIWCPFIWTSLDMHTEYQVRPGYQMWELDTIRIRFGEEMSRRNVNTPMQLRGWLKAASTDIGASSRRPADEVEREIGMLKDYDYLQAYLQ